MAPSEVRAASSTTIPSSQARPASAASSWFGTAPTPTSTTSQSRLAPSARRTALTRPSSPSSAVTPRGQAEAHPAGAVIVMDEGGQGLVGHPRQQARLQLDHRDAAAERNRRSRDLQPDIAAAHHRQPAAGLQRRLQPVGVRGAAQLQHAFQVQSRQGHAAGARAQRQDQAGRRARRRRPAAAPRRRPGAARRRDGSGAARWRCRRRRCRGAAPGCRRPPGPSARPWTGAAAGRGRSAPRRSG